MVSQYEIIGNYNVRKLPNGMYRVCVNNGNIGAGMWTESGVNQLRQTSYDDARKILLYGSGEPGWHNLKLFDKALTTMIDEESKALTNRFRATKENSSNCFNNRLLTGLWAIA